jgi:hypothetical protein
MATGAVRQFASKAVAGASGAQELMRLPTHPLRSYWPGRFKLLNSRAHLTTCSSRTLFAPP